MNNWLDEPSDLYTKLMEEPTTRRQALRYNIICAAIMLLVCIA